MKNEFTSEDMQCQNCKTWHTYCHTLGFIEDKKTKLMICDKCKKPAELKFRYQIEKGNSK